METNVYHLSITDLLTGIEYCKKQITIINNDAPRQLSKGGSEIILSEEEKARIGFYEKRIEMMNEGLKCFINNLHS